MAKTEVSPVLIFAPIGRDGPASVDVLRRAQIAAEAIEDFDTLIARLNDNAGAIVIAEEGLFGRDLNALAERVGRQPAWSDLPFVMLTSRRGEEPAAVGEWRSRIGALLGNVSLLERPVQPITLASAVRAALRARQRQFEVRDLIAARERAAHDLERMVAERTAALAEANAQLRTQMEERARMEETLRQAQKLEAVGQLTGGIAHDFNNLLAVIIGGINLLERGADETRRKRLLEGMKQAAERGAGLTRQLLAFSRRTELKPQSVDLSRRLSAMRELLDRSLRGDIHVELNFADGLWPVEVDPGELELVILNLAVNARDAMPRGGTIMVRAENAPKLRDGDLVGDFVRISIADTGVGMTPEVRQHVFEPFFTTKDVGHGSGLGLAQVYGFARQSGGTVKIESEVGKGTTVMLLLPRSTRSPEAAAEARAAQPQHAAPSPAGRVLLVEDDDEVATLVREMIEELGYEVTRTASADAALGALANGGKVDLVFSDVMMPGGMNGIDLAKEIRKRRKDVPILLTSGYTAGRNDAAAAGLKILPKPFQIDDLAAAFEESLRGARN